MKSPVPEVEIDKPADWPSDLSVLRDYWLASRGTRTMPRRGDISPAQLHMQLPHILLADVIDGGRDFRYRLVGLQLLPFFHFEPSGRLMSDVLAPFGETTRQATLESYRSVIRRRAPMRITGSGTVYGQDPKHFDALLAPLSEDGISVDAILGTFVFVWDPAHAFRPPQTGA
ncbi:MAG TPA: PAS domain-containing protein [Rhizomicrobium sp.]